jgi:hypothetical protein
MATLQKLYDEELAKERQSCFEKLSTMSSEHSKQIQANEITARQQLLETQHLASQAEARIFQLENEISVMHTTIETMRSELTRHQDARSALNTPLHGLVQFPPVSNPHDIHGPRLGFDDRAVPSLRSTAASEARRRIQPVEDQSESDLDDPKQAKGGKRKKVRRLD